MSDHYLQVFSLTQNTFFLNDKNVRLLGRKGLQQVAEVICHLIGPFCPHLSTGRYGNQPCQIFHKKRQRLREFCEIELAPNLRLQEALKIGFLSSSF